MGKYCICFCRVSTQQQDLVQQTNSIISEAERMGYDKDHQIIIEYKESGIQLSSNERAGIDKLKDSIQNNPDIDCVICWELSRIARRADVIYEIRDFFLNHKIQWVVMTPYMRLLESDGKMSQTSSIMLGLFTSLAESEMAIKKERFARGKARSRELGKYLGGHVQFGYSIDENKFIQIEEKSAAIVRQLFELYATGKYSMYSLAEEMMEYGYFDNFTSIHSVVSFLYKHLKSTNYYGDNNRPPIISKELFDKVQNVTKDNYLSLKPKSKGDVLCRRLLYNVEGYCLTTQIQSGWKGGQYIIYTNTFRKGVKITIAKNSIEPLVWECAKSLHKKFMKNENFLKKQHVGFCESLTKKYNVAKEKSQKIREKIDRTEERYIHGKISKERADEITNTLSDELTIWKNKEVYFVEQIRERMKIIQETLMNTGQDLDLLTLEQKCTLIRSVIERVVVQREKPRCYKVIVKIYSKMDNLIYVYDLTPSRGWTTKPHWEFIHKNDKWSPEDFIKPNTQGKQTKIIVEPNKSGEDIKN